MTYPISFLPEGSSVLKQGNIWTVKSTYQVKIQNAATLQNFPLSQPKSTAPTPTAIQTSSASISIGTTVTRLQPLLPAIQPAMPAALGTVIRTVSPQISFPVKIMLHNILF